jgi:citrate lyase subunit beta / citryl-CoA lyase
VSWEEVLLRSLLFAPGNETRKLAKVGSFGSDAIVLDLEDAVPDPEKEAARSLVRSALPGFADTVVLVRVNPPDSSRLAGDLDAVVCAHLDGIVVPKAEDSRGVSEIADAIGRLERERRLPAGNVKLIASVETASGVAACEEIARAAPGRLVTLLFGPVDFAADLGLEPSPDGIELLYARSRVVTAARAAALRRPIDGPYIELGDVAGLTDDTRRSRRLGFGGRVVVHPPQVEHVQRAYVELTPEAAERAQRIVESFEAAEASGSASIGVDGSFVDYPVYRQAKRLLELGAEKQART